MEQRLRLIQGTGTRHDQRSTDRRRMTVTGQILWRDAKGTTRMVPVVTKDVSDAGVSVECLGTASIPLYRLVHLQLDRGERNRLDLPASLRKSAVLSAIFRVGACSDLTGTPTEYALRLIVEPSRPAAAQPTTWATDASATRTA